MKPPIEMLIDDFEYKSVVGKNDWDEPIFSEPVEVKHCRIDRGTQYTSTTSGKQILYNSLIFCYNGLTEPLLEFEVEAVVIFDDKEHTITNVIPVYEPNSKTIYAYELEVV